VSSEIEVDMEVKIDAFQASVSARDEWIASCYDWVFFFLIKTAYR
jgi:hypothetical protein